MRQWMSDALFIQNSCHESHAILFELAPKCALFILSAEAISSKISPLLDKERNKFSSLSLDQIIATLLPLMDSAPAGYLHISEKSIAFAATHPHIQLQIQCTNNRVQTLSGSESSHGLAPKVEQFALDDVSTLCITNTHFIAALYKQYARYFTHMKQLNAIASLLFPKQRFEYLFLNHYNLSEPLVHFNHTVAPTLEAIEALQQNIALILQENFTDELRNSDAEVIMSELLMNALEYGVLKISPQLKQQKMAEDNYFSWLDSLQTKSAQRITVELTIYKNGLLQVKINDGSDGFDYSNIVKAVIHQFHGRGVTMVASMADAFFYTDKGATATFFIHYFDYEQPKVSAQRLFWLTQELSRSYKKRLEHFFGASCAHFALFSSVEALKEALQQDSEVVLVIDWPDAMKLLPQLIAWAPKSIRFLLLERSNEMQEEMLLQHQVHGVLLKDETNEEQLKHIKQSLEQYHFLQANKSKQVRHEKAQLRAYNEQQARALEKQMLVIHDEREAINSASCQIYYTPYEKVSGDIYSIKAVHQYAWVAFIIDSMGKGIAASVTAIMAAAFLNRSISVALSYGTFEFDRLVENFVDFIVPNLLDNEVLSCAFIYYDAQSSWLEYSGFGMYPLLLKRQKSVHEIPFKQPPLMRYLHDVNIRKKRLQCGDELLFYSDGLCEMENFSPTALKSTLLHERDEQRFEAAIDEQLQRREADDDITYLHFCITKATTF